MKFAVISDSHDNWPNIQKALLFIEQKGIDTIIHVGDISAGETLMQMGLHFKGHIHAILGNVSGEPEKMKEKSARAGNITIYGETGIIELDGKKIAWNHFPQKAEILAQSGKYDLVFYGHDHKPWDKKIGTTRLLNPGTLAGLWNKATFAIYDTATGKAELIILERI